MSAGDGGGLAYSLEGVPKNSGGAGRKKIATSTIPLPRQPLLNFNYNLVAYYLFDKLPTFEIQTIMSYLMVNFHD